MWGRGSKATRRLVGVAALVLVPALAAAGAVTKAVEGALGVPIEPADWDYRLPASILSPEGFSLSFGGGLANLLAQRYAGGAANSGYAIGVTGGALIGWEYGTTGFHVVGGGQSREWNDPEGVYRLTPTPKVGVMAMTHAYKNGPWVLGGTLYRSSFSLTDNFEFLRYPRSSDPLVNQYLWDLIPRAVGNTVAFDVLGTHLSAHGQIMLESPIGDFSVVGGAWTGDLDGVTQYRNTLSDSLYYRYLLQGTKEQTAWADWDGTSLGGRWELEPGRVGKFAAWYGVSDWSGRFLMNLRDPAVRSLDQSGLYYTYLEHVETGYGGFDMEGWHVGGAWEGNIAGPLRAGVSVDVSRSTFTLDVWGATPVLTIVADEGAGGQPLYHSATVTTSGAFNTVNGEVFAKYETPESPWAVRATLGLARFDGSADVLVEPSTMYFNSSDTQTDVRWSALQLGYIELAPSRMMTAQFELSYRYRLYVPLSGRWEKNGAPASFPGDATDVSLGGLHMIRATLRL